VQSAKSQTISQTAQSAAPRPAIPYRANAGFVATFEMFANSVWHAGQRRGF
jgi:hypothetical protein